MPVRLTPNRLSRRRLLTDTAGSLVLIAAPALLRHAAAQAWGSGDPFSLGVASGAPRPDGFVLWTRLAPEPLASNPETPGGMTSGDVTIGYEIAADPAMREIVRRGEVTAEEAFAYSVHFDVRGLQAGRPYWYRFLSGEAASRIGRTATLPAPGTAPERLRFGFVSCANYEHGYFSAYRHLADENPDVVLYLGDYIYEYIEERRPVVRRHSDGIEAATLPTYAIATHNIGSIRTCSGCTPRCRRSSLGTTTTCRTTMPTSGRNISTIPSCSCCGGRRPIRRSTSTCRCARSCRAPWGR
jgi:alkaline phosphatase D